MAERPAFDFDHWSRLAKEDPEDFEAQRRAVVERAIARAPAHAQARLRRLQWKLDQIRATSGTPMAACLQMQRLMWERITGPRGLLEALTMDPRKLESQPPPPNVLRLRRED